MQLKIIIKLIEFENFHWLWMLHINAVHNYASTKTYWMHLLHILKKLIYIMVHKILIKNLISPWSIIVMHFMYSNNNMGLFTTNGMNHKNN